MATKFHYLFVAAALLSAPAAFAEVHAPQAYNDLTAVPLAPAQAPRLVHGMSDLSSQESRHLESLPLQLSGAVSKVKKAKYAPKIEKLPMRQRQRQLPKQVKPVNVVMKKNAPKAVSMERKGNVKIYKKSLRQVKRQMQIRQQQIDFSESLPMPKASDSPAGL